MNTSYDIEKWANQTQLGRRIFIWGFFLKGDEINQFQLVRESSKGGQEYKMTQWQLVESSEEVEHNGIHIREYYWHNKENKEEVVKIDIMETPSWRDAHKLLLELLQQKMAADVPEASSKKITIGDVAYIGFGDTIQSLLFSRANVVINVGSIGKKHISVIDITRLLDEILIGRPLVSEKGVIPVITDFSAVSQTAKVGEKIKINIRAVDPLARPVWHKFITERGEISLQDGSVIFSSETASLCKIALLVSNENGFVAGKTIDLEIGDVLTR